MGNVAVNVIHFWVELYPTNERINIKLLLVISVRLASSISALNVCTINSLKSIFLIKSKLKLNYLCRVTQKEWLCKNDIFLCYCLFLLFQNRWFISYSKDIFLRFISLKFIPSLRYNAEKSPPDATSESITNIHE